MSKLSAIHSQLSSLRRTRQFVRLVTAFSSLVTAVVWSLAGILIFDFFFSLPILPRLVVMVLAALAIVWAFFKFTRPLLGVRETQLDMALFVERQQKIDSDLVAALQFESADAPTWGSTQLQSAVIDYVAEFSRGLNVFAGFSREQMSRRATILALTLAAAAAFIFLAPAHARVFADHLLLGQSHYPTRTSIDQVLVNNALVLIKSDHASQPLDAKSAQGSAMQFFVKTTGVAAQKGKLRLRSTAGGNSREVELKPLSRDERLARLRVAQEMIATAIAKPETDIRGPWQQDLFALLAFDAPAVAEKTQSLGTDLNQLQPLASDLIATITTLKDDADSSAIFLADMGRLVDDVRYTLHVGDAWTDPALVRMIPLPVVDLVPTIVPPAYARQERPSDPSATRQLSVLEGSSVELALTSTNNKPLKEAWLTLKSGDTVKRLDLVKSDASGLAWKLPDADSPLKKIAAEVRYELQVTDLDDLHLENPITGVIRLRADRPPTGVALATSRVVLPTATPKIRYRAVDDYGISQILLKIEIERASAIAAATVFADPAQTDAPGAKVEAEKASRVLHAADQSPLTGDTLKPIRVYDLDLSPLALAKGDRLKLTLDITDYRGDAPGQSYISEPVLLEVSDESGVLAAISQADTLTEEKITEIITKQLGIGE